MTFNSVWGQVARDRPRETDSAMSDTSPSAMITDYQRMTGPWSALSPRLRLLYRFLSRVEQGSFGDKVRHRVKQVHKTHDLFDLYGRPGGHLILPSVL